MPSKMLVSCKNRSRVQLPTPFTCQEKLKMSFVQKILIFVFFFAFLKLFSVLCFFLYVVHIVIYRFRNCIILVYILC